MERTPHEIGDIMRQAPVSVFIRAGTARRSGNGIALVLGDRTFFLPPEEMGVLHSDRNAAIVNDEGDQEGIAWFSPVLAKKKQELTALIHDRIYTLSCRDLQALFNGARNGITIREYRSLQVSYPGA